jgi:predicted RNase H-like HicB family nuclease
MKLMKVDMPFRDTPFWAALHPIEGGGYWAAVQELPGCVAQADQLDELKEHIAQAIIDWLQGSSEKTEDEARQLAEIQGGPLSTEETYLQPYTYLPPSDWVEEDA